MTRRRARWWLVAGFCAGLALLSKYHALFFLAGVGIFMLTSARQRFWLATPWPYAAGFLALSAVFAGSGMERPA